MTPDTEREPPDTADTADTAEPARPAGPADVMEARHEIDVNRRLATVWRDSRLGPTVETLRKHILREGATSLELAQYRPLHALCEQGPMPMNQLAHAVGATQSSVSRSVQQLERGALVTRVQSETDLRSFTVSVTSRGESVHGYLVDRAFDVYSEIFAVFTVEEREALAMLLERLLESVDSVLSTSRGNVTDPAFEQEPT